VRFSATATPVWVAPSGVGGADLNLVAFLGARGIECPNGNLQDVNRLPDDTGSVGREGLDGPNHVQILIKKQHVNGKTHPKGVNPVAAVQQQAFAFAELPTVQQADHALEHRIGKMAIVGDNCFLRGVDQNHRNPLLRRLLAHLQPNADKRGAEQHDKQRGKNEQDEWEHDLDRGLHGHLLRPLATADADRIGLDTKCVGDAPTQTARMHNRRNERFQVVDPGAICPSLPALPDGVSQDEFR